MKILVGVKRVIDFSVNIRVKADGSGVETANVKMAMNPFDEIAVEEAVRLREAGIASEVIVVSIGPTKAQETVRTALAMGSDRGVLVETDELVEPLAVAKILKSIADKEQVGMVLLGKQAIDDDCNQTGQMLAALMNCAQATFVSTLKVSGDNAEVGREVDAGRENIRVKLPAVFTVDLRLNNPRYATLPEIMKAKKKPLDIIKPTELGIDITPRLTTLKVSPPPQRATGIKVNSVAELISKAQLIKG